MGSEAREAQAAANRPFFLGPLVTDRVRFEAADVHALGLRAGCGGWSRRPRPGTLGVMRTGTRTRTATTSRPGLRRALPWVGAGLAVHGAVTVAGLVWARRRDEGDDSTAGIRRVRIMGGVQLRPRNPELSRIRLDLVMARGEVDLSGLAPVPGGIDVTVHAVMGGAAVRVPSGWRVWSGLHAVAGGVGLPPGVTRVADGRGADLRLHGFAVMGGIGIEAAA